MENVRYNVSPCSREEVQAFISRINADVYEPKNTVFADERSHYDRYSFLRGESKIAVVYDTTARVISITAPQNYADELLSVFSPNDKAVKRSTVPAQGTRTNAAQPTPIPRTDGSNVKAESATRCRVFEKPKEPIRTAPTVIATAKGVEMYSDEICPPQRVTKRARAEASADSELRRGNRVPNGFLGDEIAPPQIVRRNPDKKFNNNERQSQAYKQSNYSQQPQSKPSQAVPMPTDAGKQPRGAVVGDTNSKAQNTKQNEAQPKSVVIITADARERAPRATGIRHTTISFGDEDYAPRSVRQTPNLRAGTGLYADISSVTPPDQAQQQSPAEPQPKRGRGRPPKAAVQNRQNNGTVDKAEKLEKLEKPEDKRLKRRIPTAYEFLPQQARDDLSGGLKNFEQTKLTMTDYSGLLMQPYRGLEAFVLDLQRRYGIRVKMIGQAFDKDGNGNYVLKSGYMQKIGSVVYGEVMVALYSEYCSRRNYFAHTDNSEDGSVPRSIPDRNIAKDMFDNLLKVIEYNARKLKEIGFGNNRNNEQGE